MLEYTLNYSLKPGFIVVKLSGSIRSDEALDIFADLISLLSEKIQLKKQNIIFDFTLLKLINSSGIGKMLVFNKSLLDQDCQLYLICVSPALKQLFKFARIDQLLKIHTSYSDIN